MREIKFRGWDVGFKEMESWESLLTSDVLPEVLQGVFPNLKLMQYTGLKDKNGVEIYEGDIIEQQHYFKNYDGTLDEFFKQKKVVGDIRKAIFGLYDVLENITVIGNRYENPELLEEESTC